MQGEIEIILGGKPRKLKYCMRAIEENERLLKKNNGPIHYSSIGSLLALIHAGLLSQYHFEKKDVDFSEHDVAEWVYDLFDEENGWEQVKAVNECFTNCNAYKNMGKAHADLEDKKKSNGMTSTPLLSES